MKTTTTMQTAFETNENLSLRKVAQYFDVNYNMLLKAAKTPKVGEVYDPTATNYTAMEQYLTKKGYNLEEVDWDAISELATTVRVQLPKEFAVGQLIKLRQDDTTYQIHMLTETHVVIMGVDATQPRVMSLPTFMHQGPKNV